MSLKLKLTIGGLIIVLAGSVSGLLLSAKFNPQVAGSSDTTEVVKTDKEHGVKDTQTFSDSAVGTLEKGGINGQGTHKLVLDSNPKNSAFLMSSIVDLDEFNGKHIEVRGQTFKGQGGIWLMDVGLVKILD